MSVIAIVLVGYGVVAIVVARLIAGHFAWRTALHYNQRRPDGGDWALAAVGGVCLAVIWPVAVVWTLVGWSAPVVGAEREARVRQQEDRIRELERQLEVAGR